jgi:hypothetical protein
MLNYLCPHGELVTLVLVHWTELAEISDGNRIHRHNRLFTNWHREREKFNSANQRVSLHRISTKRVVLETTTHDQPRRKHALRKLLAFVAILVALAIASLQASNLLEVKESVHSEPSQATQIACARIDLAKGLLVDRLSRFQFENWNVETYGSPRKVGSLVSVSFEATCKERLLVGQLVANKTQTGILILQMAPIL